MTDSALEATAAVHASGRRTSNSRIYCKIGPERKDYYGRFNQFYFSDRNNGFVKEAK